MIPQRYEVVRPLGTGGMGSVYLVRDTTQGGKPIALKVLRRESVDPCSAERFRDEFRSMARLRHPNLAEVYDFDTAGAAGAPFLTMEYVEGRDLASFRWPEIARHLDDLVIQCLRALDYIHSRGILHNDIKPQNIMVRPPFEVKLLDFGLAQGPADPGATGLSGTLHYVAPERLKGEPADARSDFYSLGVVLYQLATGELPYDGAEIGQVIGAILRGRPRPPRELNTEVSRRVESLILALLAPDQARRPGSAGEALALLNRGSSSPQSLDTPETHASFVGSGRFTGRDAELADLLELATASAGSPGQEEGRPRLALISGASGIGKSRLLRELKHRLQLAGTRCLTGRCYEDGGVPFQPFVEALRQAPPDETMPSEQRAYLEPILPAGAASAGRQEERAGPGAIPTDKSTFIAGLAGALEFLARRTPGVMFLEDLHWGDAPSIELLEHLLLRPRRIDWLLIASLRDDEAAQAPARVLIERFRDPSRLRRMSLKPLGVEQITDLLASMVPFESRPERLAGLLSERTGGNPLYIEELMRSLAEGGTLRRSGRAWITESRSLDAIQLPPSLASVVARRLASLPREEREAAEALAVFNRPVTSALLAQALALDAAAAGRLLESLARLRIAVVDAEREGPAVTGLAHSRIREAIYGALPDDRRRALHLAIATSIESLQRGAIDQVVEELAHHYTQAGEPARAAEYSLRAARKAQALFNFRQEVLYLERALTFLPPADERRVSTLLTMVRTKHANLMDYEGAIRDARVLQDEARRAGDKPGEAGALRLQALGMSYTGAHRNAVDLAKRALTVARAVGETRLLITCLNSLGTVLARLGDHRKALAHFEESMKCAESLGDFGIVFGSRCNIALTQLCLGRPEVSREIFEEILGGAKQKGLTYEYYRNLPNLAIARQETGDLVGAIQVLEECFAWAREHFTLEMIGLQLSGLGQAYAHRGLFDRALGAFEQERALHERLGNQPSQLQLLDFIGNLHRELGRYDLAKAEHKKGLDLARRLGARVQEGHLLASLAADHLESGASGVAEELAREALAIGRELGHPRVTFFALATLALAAAGRRDRRAMVSAMRHLRLQDPHRLRFHDRLLLNLVLGRCALTLRRFADAEREARAGLAAAERGGYREFHWKHLALLGDALSERDLPREATDAYNAAQRFLHQIAEEIEDAAMRQDYERDERREEVDRKAAQAAPAVEPVPVSLATVTDAPVKMLATIYEISQIINTILDLKELLNKVMDLAIEIVRAERGLVFLYRSETDEMELVVARNMERQTIKDATEYSRSVLREAGRGRSILSHDAVTDSRFKEFRSVSLYHIRSLLCVPLRIKERVIGTVYVDTREAGVVFTDDDLRFLETFANQAAVAIENARLYDQIRQENQYLKQAVHERYGYESIIGRSPKMREVFALLSRVAQSHLPVLIRGESGTGKELVAKAVHHNSTRRERKFFSENCAALPDTLLESELFGHMRGSFTGADSSRKGLFEMADGGTLFLDEIGDMSMTLQSKLLRVLQEGEVRPVGSESSRHVDVRIISATNRNLEVLIKEKRFREDLYFRLNVISVKIPAVRDRQEDIPLLVDHFLAKVARENNAPKLRVDPALMALLTRYDWPGNVRELENQIYRLALFATGDTLTLTDAKHDAEFFEKVTTPGIRGVDSGVTREAIEEALSKAKGGREMAARLLGISRATMFRKLKQYDLGPRRPKPHRRIPSA